MSDKYPIYSFKSHYHLFQLQNISHLFLIGFLSDILTVLGMEAVLFVWSAFDSIAGRQPRSRAMRGSVWSAFGVRSRRQQLRSLWYSRRQDGAVFQTSRSGYQEHKILTVSVLLIDGGIRQQTGTHRFAR